MARRRRTAYYFDVLASERWLLLKRRLLAERGYRCQHCAVTGVGLDLHHVTYDRLGCERDDDLLVLCRPCHKRADRARRKAARERLAPARYQARVHGWACKVYGPEWQRFHDHAVVAHAFDAWLAQRSRRS
jgi:5-methylcytosine-specific restriction endonuclease McrA